jgi:hypothetical protein
MVIDFQAQGMDTRSPAGEWSAGHLIFELVVFPTYCIHQTCNCSRLTLQEETFIEGKSFDDQSDNCDKE